MKKRILVKEDEDREILADAHLVKDEWAIKLKDKFGDYTGDEQISLVSDAMFSTMFQDSSRIKYPCKLLSTILNVSYEELLSRSSFYKNVFDSDKYTSKKERGDLVLRMDDTVINIEANRTPKVMRNSEYLDRVVRENVLIGGDYLYPASAIQININNYVLKGVKDTVEIYRVQEPRGKLLSYKVLIQVYVPLIREKEYTYGKKSLSELERCVLVMTTDKKKQAEYLAKGDKTLEEYVMEAEFVRLRDTYLGPEYDRDEKHREEGRFEGHEKGLIEGREKGLEEGYKKTAENMLKDGVPIETVHKYTNLSLYQLEAMQKSFQPMMVADDSCSMYDANIE